MNRTVPASIASATLRGTLAASPTRHTFIMQESGGTRKSIEARIEAFTTGRGSMFGLKPAPCIKLATNTLMFNRLQEDMDINCGEILDGTATMKEMGQRIFELFLRTALGEPSKSELLGLGDHEFVPWQIGIMS